MSKTKEYFIQIRQREIADEQEDADYRYEQFLREQYPQHFEKEKSTITNKNKNNDTTKKQQ